MSTFQDIKRKIADYCVYQDRCHWEVEQKLKTYSFLNNEERGEIIIWLIQNQFLNEERFAKAYTRGKFYQKKWGRIKIKASLKQKQIPDQLIHKALKEIEIEDYKKILFELGNSKWNTIKDVSIFSKKKKVLSYLLQKGYESNLIYSLLDDLGK